MEKYQFNLRLQQLFIQNFRGFENLEIKFDENLTVLIGINGSGKSSILDLLAENFRQMVNAWFQLGKDKFYLESKKDIKYGSSGTSKNELNFEVTYLIYDNEENLISTQQEDKTVINLDLKLYPSFVSMAERDLDDNQKVSILSEMRTTFETLKRTDLDKIHLPILAYYQSVGLSQNNQMKDDFDTHILSVYDDLLENRSISFKNIKKWFEWRQKLDLQRQQRSKNNESFQKTTDNIYQNVLLMLNDEKENIFNEIYIDWEKSQDGEFVLVKNGSLLKENQLSSGEKLLFTLVADISYKLALANPQSQNPSKEGFGIILIDEIDEIDLHLHPKWQRKVVTKLREIFPNVQFVVTTHSPFVVQSVEANQRFTLSEGTIKVLEHDDDLSYEVIMRDYFGDAKLFDNETEFLIEKFDEFKTKILKREILLQDKFFLDLLKEISGKSNEVKDLVARELRYIKSQL